MTAISRSDAVRYLRAALPDFARQSDDRRYYRLFDRALLAMADEGVISRERWNEVVTRAIATSPTLFLRQSSLQERALISSLVDGLLSLISHGYLVPGIDYRDGHLDFYDLSVTTAGLGWASGENHVPEDGAGYIAALRSATPSLNPVVERYIVEAIRTYNDGSIFSAAVMLGVASEAVVYDLADAVLIALKSSKERKNLEGEVGRHKMDDILERVSEVTKRAAASAMPYAVHEGAVAHLASLQEAIRVQRNKSGHPTAENVEPTTVRLALSAFPTACSKAYQLADWLRQHPSSV